MEKILFSSKILFLIPLFISPLWALVNPSLQPKDLCERYQTILLLQVAKLNEAEKVVCCQVKEVIQGEFAKTEVVISANPEQAEEITILEDLSIHQPMVAWVGKRGRGKKNEVVLYVGHRKWYFAEFPQATEPHRWYWTHEGEETLVGTWNGATERLCELLRDIQKGISFFPADVFTKFQNDHIVNHYRGPLGGVALYDLNQDGLLDILVGTSGGVKVLIQYPSSNHSLTWKDSTETLGLSGVSGHSISIADINQDGYPDLLLNDQVYLYDPPTNRYTFYTCFSKNRGESVKVSAFLDSNHDGFPDILISRVNGGLQLLENQFNKNGGFIDVTQEKGLGTHELSQGNGYFTIGDLDGDGKVDIFYAIQNGIFLKQTQEGNYILVFHRLNCDFRGGPNLIPGLTGAGCIAPIWRNDQMSLIIPQDTELLLVTWNGKTLQNVTGYGNEIALATQNQIATLAEDLDMDGYVDLFTISRSRDNKNCYHCNRGYGSFMKSEIYEPNFFPSDSYEQGATGIAVGDINNDGANDLILAGIDGTLRIVFNDCLSLRKNPLEHPTYHQKKLYQTAVLSVHVRGKGTLGATVSLYKDSQLVTLRSIGYQVLTGCRGPDSVHIALREPGPYQVVVRYSDYFTCKRDILIQPGVHSSIIVSRESP